MFTVEVLTPRGLVRYVVLFVIELSTRRVSLAGLAVDPGENWVKQVFRNQLDAFDGFLLGKRYILINHSRPYRRVGSNPRRISSPTHCRLHCFSRAV